MSSQAPRTHTANTSNGASPIDEQRRQDVLDTAAALQARRTSIARRLALSQDCGAELIGPGHETIQAWLDSAIPTWSELLSVRPSATVTQLRHSLPNNRAQIARGLNMISVFDFDRLDLATRLLLQAEPVGDYRFAYAPLQMKIADRSGVLLQGPFIDGQPHVMLVRTAECVAAAMRYWTTLLRSEITAPAHQASTDLTPRQRCIVALLATDTPDHLIASTMNVSIRTVRGDIAAILRAAGSRSRFSAGYKIGGR